MSKFAAIHPGGAQILLQEAGKDITEKFYAFHRQDVLNKYKKIHIGYLEGQTHNN